MTDLDRAQAAADAAPETATDQARMDFFRILADTPLYLLLEREPLAEVLEPRIFNLEEGQVVLAFDSQERLAGMGQGPLPFAELPGRVLARLLAQEGLGLGLNLGSAAPSEMLLPVSAMRWLEQILAEGPDLHADHFGALSEPDPDLVRVLRAILDQAPPTWGGLAQSLWVYGREGAALVVIEGADPDAETALATALSEALRFADLAGRAVDIAFASRDRLPDLGTVLSWPEIIPPPEPQAPAAPGSIKDKPPILR